MKIPLSYKQVKRVIKTGAWILLILFILPSAGLSSGGGIKTSIQMLPSITVEKDTILLGDIAIVNGKDPMFVADLEALVVGRAPLPGKSRHIDDTYVMLRLKQKGILPGQIILKETGQTEVHRSSTLVDSEQIKGIIRDALHQEDLFQGRQGTVRDIRVAGDLVVPSGDVSYRVAFAKKTTRSNKIPVSVSIRVNGKHYRKIWCTLVADIFQEVVVLSKTLRRHQRITAEDIKSVAMNLSEIPQNAILSDQDILGKRVTKSLLSGTVLRTDTVELPPLVKRGDVVTISAKLGVLQVTTLGKAKMNGRQGERIKVLNIDTHKELYGFVVDAKTVKVVF